MNFTRVEVIHPHWNGFLRLSNVDDDVFHENHGSKGVYSLRDGNLIVNWEIYGRERFVSTGRLFVHESLLPEIPKLHKLFSASINEQLITLTAVTALVPDTSYEIVLRLRTSDTYTFEQIFVQREYNSRDLPEYAGTILDLGANIGLASVFFGLKYPTAKIFAVEPEESNFARCCRNTSALGDRVQCRHAAVWTRDDTIHLHTESEGGSLGAWGVQVSDRPDPSNRETKCYKLLTLMREAEFDYVDILKIDIEGAELEIFSEGSEEWLSKIGLIIVETHERFRPGSDGAVRNALRPMFDELPGRAENLFFRRKLS